MESPKASTSASPASATPNPLLQRNLKKLKKPSNKKSKPASSKKGNASSSALAVQVGTEEEEREFQARLLEEMEALAKEAEGEEAKGETEARLLEGALGDGETLGGNGGDLLAIGEAGRKDAGGGDARSSAHQPALKSKESKHHHHGLGDKLLELGEDLADKLHVHAGAYGHGPEGPAEGEKKVSRQQARKLRQAAQFEALRAKAEAEVSLANDHSIEEERAAIALGCTKLGVKIKDIIPDGHCLYSAIADQVNLLGLSLKTPSKPETYETVRHAAAKYMRAHPDEFLPFLERATGRDDDGLLSKGEYETYCKTVENTSEWGGQPEILALSQYFNSPIHILQAGTDLVKIGSDMDQTRRPMLISYHRKMYGLGEHYNSLVPQ